MISNITRGTRTFFSGKVSCCQCSLGASHSDAVARNERPHRRRFADVLRTRALSVAPCGRSNRQPSSGGYAPEKRLRTRRPRRTRRVPRGRSCLQPCQIKGSVANFQGVSLLGMADDIGRGPRIKRLIRRLTDMQGEAFERSIYIPLTADEVIVCDERRAEIRRLSGELSTQRNQSMSVCKGSAALARQGVYSSRVDECAG